MALDLPFTCPLASGLHARPASRLAEIARRFDAACVVTNARTGVTADVKSVLAVLTADVGAGDACVVRVDGRDEAAAREALQAFLQSELPGYEDPPTPVATEAARVLPRPLETSGASWWRGLAVSPGVGTGRVVAAPVAACASDDVDANDADDVAPIDPQVERQRVTQAIHTVRTRLVARLGHRASAAEAAILAAHVAIVTDPLLLETLFAAIGRGRSAPQAIVDGAAHFTGALGGAGTPTVRERVADIQGICVQLLDEACGSRMARTTVPLAAPSVMVAETMTPQALLDLDRRWISGIVLETAGTTSHTVILARALGIPMVVGIPQARRLLVAGEDVVVDGHRGLAVAQLTDSAREFYARELKRRRAREGVAARAAMGPVTTADGRGLEVGANVSSMEELDGARRSGADGIGLFRTELLCLRAHEVPSEDAQYAIYAEAVRVMQGRPVIIRTLDFGGDKPVAALPRPAEANPFLGCRGVRAYVEHQEIVRTQLRAIVRASATGPVQLLVPMVSSIEEVLWVKAQVAHVQDELAVDRVSFDRDMPIGIMLEVPAVSFVLDRLCDEVDFFSIGTNDLCQYFFAADRGNARVAPLASVSHPGFLKFLKQIVDEVRARGRWVGLCGEMAGDIRWLPLLVGLGLDEISAASQQIPALKARIARLSAADCTERLAAATACGSAEEVEALLDHARVLDRPRALLDPEIVRFDGSCGTKEEAIRTLVDVFFAAGRTDDPCSMEDAVWRREAQYATGVGDGIAVPHCRTDAVTSDSIGILKLQSPVDWGALDGQPVRMVFLLATRETSPDGAHMQVFSRLARKLMDAEFRAHLLRADDPRRVIDQLTDGLQMVL
ncbi:MAG: phosphoenolpyruvate--protein phosphotransferase [Acidobacteriota bacterium]